MFYQLMIYKIASIFLNNILKFDKMKKHFLKFLSFALTALSTFTAFAQSESIVTLAGNAYITAATQQTGETNQRARRNRTFIDEHNSAIRNHQPMGTHR